MKVFGRFQRRHFEAGIDTGYVEANEVVDFIMGMFETVDPAKRHGRISGIIVGKCGSTM